MPMINLLPWREELRQKRKKEFLGAALGAVLFAAAATLATQAVYDWKISNQNSRNDMLDGVIAELDETIAEIERLEAEKQRMIDRKQVIEQLEATTPEAVTLVDSLVDAIPDGVYLTQLSQQGTQIKVTGVTQSNARVADFMRNVEKSPWLKEAWPDVIANEGAGPVIDGRFTLDMIQVRLSDLEEEEQL